MNITAEELDNALKLNAGLANKRAPGNAEDLIGVGHETIVRCLDKFDPSRGSKFTNFLYPYLMRDHRRAQIDILAAVHIPHTEADFNRKIDGKFRVEIDGLENWSHPDQPKRQPSRTSADIQEALAGLPAVQRELLELHYLEGYTMAEIARQYRLSKDAISKRLKNARAALLALYKDEPAPPVTDEKAETIPEALKRFGEGEPLNIILSHCDIPKTALYRHASSDLKAKRRTARKARIAATPKTAAPARRRSVLKKADLSSLEVVPRQIVSDYCNGKTSKEIAAERGTNRLDILHVLSDALKAPGYKAEFVRENRRRTELKRANLSGLPALHQAVVKKYCEGTNASKVASAFGLKKKQ